MPNSCTRHKSRQLYDPDFMPDSAPTAPSIPWMRPEVGGFDCPELVALLPVGSGCRPRCAGRRRAGAYRSRGRATRSWMRRGFWRTTGVQIAVGGRGDGYRLLRVRRRRERLSAVRVERPKRPRPSRRAGSRRGSASPRVPEPSPAAGWRVSRRPMAPARPRRSSGCSRSSGGSRPAAKRSPSASPRPSASRPPFAPPPRVPASRSCARHGLEPPARPRVRSSPRRRPRAGWQRRAPGAFQTRARAVGSSAGKNDAGTTPPHVSHGRSAFSRTIRASAPPAPRRRAGGRARRRAAGCGAARPLPAHRERGPSGPLSDGEGGI